MRPALLPLATALLLGLLALPAAAQRPTTLVVAGVADARTGAPLAGAELVLPDLRRIVTTNWMGEARLASVPRGQHRMRVRKLGYAPSDVTLQIEGDSTGPVFFLEPVVATLDTVRTMGRRPEPPLPRGAPPEFGSRRAMGIGRFLTETDLAREQDREFLSVMQGRVPGMRRQVRPDGSAYLAVMRSACGSASRPTPRLGAPRRGGDGGASGGASMQSSCMNDLGCPIRVYLDNLDVTEDVDLVRTWDLAAIEFHSAASTPAQYRDTRAGCGVMLLWSKR